MTSKVPDLPEVLEDDTMLSRKFGREVVNYFSGSPLNRVSFLRTDHKFLRSAFSHPSTRFMLLDNLAPLVHSNDEHRLAFATIDEVAPFTGIDPLAKTEAEMIADFNSEEAHPLILFVGVDEKQQFPDTTSDFVYKEYKGSPYFAIDVTPKGKLADKAKALIESVTANGRTFYRQMRPTSFSYMEGLFRLTSATCCSVRRRSEALTRGQLP